MYGERLQSFALRQCFLVVSDVNFRMASKSRKQQPRKSAKNRGKLVMRRFSRVHIQAVGIRLSTSGILFFISVQNTVEFMVVISLLHSAAALRTVDVHSTPILL